MNFYIAEPVTRLPLFNFLVRYIFTEVLKYNNPFTNITNLFGNEQNTELNFEQSKQDKNNPGDKVK